MAAAPPCGRLRQQREWKRYKAELLAAATDRPPTRLQMLIGPRRFASSGSDERDGAALGDAAGGRARPGSGPSKGSALGSAGARAADDGRFRMLEGLHKEVNGAASSELAAASADMGTTITEEFSQRNYLQPRKNLAPTPPAEQRSRHARARINAVAFASAMVVANRS